jgi:hypothetical protein
VDSVPCDAAAAGEPCDGCRMLFVRLERRLIEMEARLRELERGRHQPQGRPTGKWKIKEDTPNLAEYFEFRTSEFEQRKGACQLSVVRGDIIKADEQWKAHLVAGDTLKGQDAVDDELVLAFGAPEMRKPAYEVGTVRVWNKGESHLINLVAKDKSSDRLATDPEKMLANMVVALEALRLYCGRKDIRRLALVRLGATFERVHWRWTQRKLLDVFADLDIHLVVYMSDRPSSKDQRTEQWVRRQRPTSIPEHERLRPRQRLHGRRDFGQQTSPCRAPVQEPSELKVLEAPLIEPAAVHKLVSVLTMSERASKALDELPDRDNDKEDTSSFDSCGTWYPNVGFLTKKKRK